MPRYYRPRVRTKNHTADILRPKNKELPRFEFRSVIRLGSTSEVKGIDVEINTVDSVKTSSHKVNMKKAFEKYNLYQAPYYTIDGNSLRQNNIVVEKNDLPFPLVAKKIYSSKGKGMIKLDNVEFLNTFLNGNTNGYFIEKFYNYSKEYRVHSSILSECFYTCRKVRLKDAKDKWFFNSTNCNWLVQSNPNFDRPKNWKEIIRQSKLAIESVGLDIGAVDIRVQSNEKENPHFIICEVNSAPSFGEITAQKYLYELPKLLLHKWKN